MYSSRHSKWEHKMFWRDFHVIVFFSFRCVHLMSLLCSSATMKDRDSLSLLHYSGSGKTSPQFPSAALHPSSPVLGKAQPFCLQSGQHLIASMQLQKLNSHYQNLSSAATTGPGRGYGTTMLGPGQDHHPWGFTGTWDHWFWSGRWGGSHVACGGAGFGPS